MNVLTCGHLVTILPSHVMTYAVCPGFCHSNLGRNVPMSLYKKSLPSPIFLLIQRTTSDYRQDKTEIW